MSQSEFIHTLSESKNTFALEQKPIILGFVKNVAIFLGHPVQLAYIMHDPLIHFPHVRNMWVSNLTS